MKSELLTLLGWLLLATVAHEGVHFVLLRRAGAEPKFCWHGIGFGWRFSPEGVGSERLVTQWLAGPLVEGAMWLLGAAVLPHLLGPCLLVGAFELGGNLLLPGSDGRRAWRAHGGRPVECLKGGSSAPSAGC